MNAIILMVVGLGSMILGYVLYAKFLAEKIYRLRPDAVTPSHEFEDGVDFVPTNRFVLWGHHFTSVAGAAPIVGPAIAVIWGWLPAFLWVTIGTVFFAGVHDFGALWASVRNKGRSVGALTESVISKRARSLFMVVIFLLLIMLNAVFAVVIAKLLVQTPESVVPAWSAVAVALVIGWLMYKRGIGLALVSAIGIAVLYGAIGVGQLAPIELPRSVAGLSPNAQWVIILFVYAAIASLLPVWLLLQPRDYINGLQLIIGLVILYVSVVLFAPTLVAPAWNGQVPAGTPPIVPLLFVTIACGAISGFHGLVAGGTTSKQLDKESDARFVGYMGSVGEGGLALATIIVCTAGFASLEEWRGVYTEFTKGGLDAFVNGGAVVINNGIGLPVGIAATLLSVMGILFAATTMDTGVRLQRYIFQEWAEIYGLDALRNNAVATFLAVGSCLVLAFGFGGAEGDGGLIIWPLFGTTNQLLAGLTLLVVTVLVVQLGGRRLAYTLTPLCFLLAMTILALLYQLWGFATDGNWVLVTLDLIVLVCAFLVALEAFSTLNRERQDRGTAQAAAAGGGGD